MKKTVSFLSASFLLAASLISPFAFAGHNFNLQLDLEDEHGDSIENLSEHDFAVLGGTDNEIYDFDEVDEGSYQFELNNSDDDTEYTILIDDEASINIGPLTDELITYQVVIENFNVDSCDDHDFRDVNNHWVEDALEGNDGLLCRGVVEGRDSNDFDPNDEISRAEFLTMVIRNAGIDVEDYDDGSEPYADVSKNDWEYDYVVAARALDIIDYDFYFHPNENITRAEMVTMLLRAEDVYIDGGSTPFADIKETKWYADEVFTAYDLDLVVGFADGNDTYFYPAKDATRAEAAEFINNAHQELH